jgi:hypothetical protein
MFLMHFNTLTAVRLNIDVLMSIVHRLLCNTTFHKTYHHFTGLKVFKLHYMFRPTWPSSGVKNVSYEEIAAFPCC